MLESVKILSTFDPAFGEFIPSTYNNSDVFSSARCKEQLARPKSMNEFLRSNCSSSAYMFEVKAVCWQILAN